MASINRFVLIALTSHSTLGNTNLQTGFWLEELAEPYYKFKGSGYEVHLASTKGGKAPIDPNSISNTETQPKSVIKFLSDVEAMNAVNTTKPIQEIEAGKYETIFLAGGHGTMWDFPYNESLGNLLRKFYTQEKIISAVCHGVAGLLNISQEIRGRNITGFTNEEEMIVQLDKVVPFLLENRLNEAGLNYTKKDPFMPYIVEDGNIITGQNPQSSGLAAEKIISILNIK